MFVCTHAINRPDKKRGKKPPQFRTICGVANGRRYVDVRNRGERVFECSCVCKCVLISRVAQDAWDDGRGDIVPATEKDEQY